MRAFLENTGLFDKEEIEHSLSFAREINLSKGEYYIQEGKTAKKFAFIKSGLLRSFYYSSIA